MGEKEKDDDKKKKDKDKEKEKKEEDKGSAEETSRAPPPPQPTNNAGSNKEKAVPSVAETWDQIFEQVTPILEKEDTSPEQKEEEIFSDAVFGNIEKALDSVKTSNAAAAAAPAPEAAAEE